VGDRTKVLRVGTLAPIGTLDPQRAHDFSGHLVIAQVFESPYVRVDGRLEPRLVVGTPLRRDPQTFELEVRRDRCFSDGSPVTAEDVAVSSDASIRDCDWYGGSDSLGFAIRDATGRMACLQWYWFGSRYQSASFWPLSPTEAVSMQLLTLPEYRNRGLATALKRLSARSMTDRGFTALYSRIWWTNEPSLRVSAKAGWQMVGTLLRLSLPLRREPISIAWENPVHLARGDAGRAGRGQRGIR